MALQSARAIRDHDPRARAPAVNIFEALQATAIVESLVRPRFDKSVGWSRAVVKGMTTANKTVETNRRPALPLNAGPQFECAACAPPFLSAAVAHLCRSPE